MAYKGLRGTTGGTGIGGAVMIGEAIGRLVTGVSKVDEAFRRNGKKNSRKNTKY